MIVLIRATVRLLNKNFIASILSNSPEKFSIEKTLGKNFGGTAITSDPGLNAQQIT